MKRQRRPPYHCLNYNSTHEPTRARARALGKNGKYRSILIFSRRINWHELIDAMVIQSNSIRNRNSCCCCCYFSLSFDREFAFLIHHFFNYLSLSFTRVLPSLHLISMTPHRRFIINMLATGKQKIRREEPMHSSLISLARNSSEAESWNFEILISLDSLSPTPTTRNISIAHSQLCLLASRAFSHSN